MFKPRALDLSPTATPCDSSHRVPAPQVTTSNALALIAPELVDNEDTVEADYNATNLNGNPRRSYYVPQPYPKPHPARGFFLAHQSTVGQPTCLNRGKYCKTMTRTSQANCGPTDSSPTVSTTTASYLDNGPARGLLHWRDGARPIIPKFESVIPLSVEDTLEHPRYGASRPIPGEALGNFIDRWAASTLSLVIFS
ncbi:hypothetical protein D9613_003628 [Agrocybe pediades]|uniref:Uncharacterized protein n=1 Tax=Agrocybe pediades TaxID=84607 RepID=A0A8H4QI65_9AGAR|nr:hypothetical protein D9613_003628 [Agrocybe pediades]